MPPSRRILAALGLSVAGALCAAHAVPAQPTCYGVGQRCAGAPDKPFVEPLPCCGGASATCTATRDGEYGLFCVGVEPFEPITGAGSGGDDSGVEGAPQPTCYGVGQRCAGAPDQPFVEPLPCCGGASATCSLTREGEYGLFCVGVEPFEPITGGMEMGGDGNSGRESPDGHNGGDSGGAEVAPQPKCYGVGQRCAGAPGQPFVEPLPCCGGASATCSQTREGEYGMFCVGVEPFEPVTGGGMGINGGEEEGGDAPPPQARTCYGVGERCIGAEGEEYVEPLPCCGGASAVCALRRDGEYGLFCVGVEPFEPITGTGVGAP